MKTAQYIFGCILSVTAIGSFAQVSPVPQPQPTQQPTNPVQPQVGIPNQQQVPNPAQQQMNNPIPPGTLGMPQVTDPTTQEKLRMDLQTQSTAFGNQPVNWYNNSSNGYIGTTSYNNTNYMVQYDAQGTFQQSYTQGDWNSNNVPASLKSSFQNSPYSSQQVTGYWTASDPNQKSYYLQTTDNQGNVTGLWGDETGKLSTTPPRTNNPR